MARAAYIIALDEPEHARRSLELYEQSYELANELEDKHAMARALLATTWFRDFWPEHLPKALTNIEEVLAISRDSDDEELQIEAQVAHFRIMRYQDRLGEAGEIGERLIPKLEAANDQYKLKEHYFQLSVVHDLIGNFKRCVECCETGIELAAQLG